MSKAESFEKVEGICRIIAAFGTGITNFKIEDIEIEKVLSGFSQSDKTELVNKIDKAYLEG